MIWSDLVDYLEGNEYITMYTHSEGMYFIHASDSSVIAYLNSNGFPVVYSSINHNYILVDFS